MVSIMSKERNRLGEILTSKQLVDNGYFSPESDALFVNITVDQHSAFLTAVWKMEDEDVSPACREKVERIIELLNLFQDINDPTAYLKKLREDAALGFSECDSMQQ